MFVQLKKDGNLIIHVHAACAIPSKAQHGTV